MKNHLRLLLPVIIFLLLFGCNRAPQSTEPSVEPSTEPTTTESIPEPVTGWVDEGANRYYYLADGSAAKGWLEIDGIRYYFGENGAMHMGWLALDGKQYFLNMDGSLRTGWIEADGKQYYLDPAQDGAAHTGWLEQEGQRYYMDAQGVLCTGWLTLDETRYYLGTDGVMRTGWLTLGSDNYYLRADGAMARGKVEIDGTAYYFAGNGTQILLVNPWNYLPEDYTTELTALSGSHKISTICYDELMTMIADAKKAGHSVTIRSSFRTYGDQKYLYNKKVNYYLDLGYSEAEAKKVAATIIAIPGTSEHQLGLALDLVDSDYPHLEEAQENTDTQKWLMANSWRYGFILRYPNEKSDITGIIYEPWHYRYVGKEIAKEIYESGLCLEEYLTSLS